MPKNPKEIRVKKFKQNKPLKKKNIQTKTYAVQAPLIEPHHIIPDFFNLENLIRFATLLYVLALLPVFGLKQSTVVVDKSFSPAHFIQQEVLGEKVTRLPIPIYPRWRVAYQNGLDRQEPITVERIETHHNLSFDWGTYSPHVAINPDHFSITYETQYEALRDGFYNITASADEQIKVYVDQSKILDQAIGESLEQTETVFLSKGMHALEVAYFEKLEQARMMVDIR